MFKKRGVSHLEMIFSFILFITFIAFLFLVIKPYNSSSLSWTVIDRMQDTFEEQTYTNLSRFFLKVNRIQSDLSNCFKINLSQEDFKYKLKNSIVFDIDGNLHNSKFDSNNGFLSIDETKTSDIYYWVIFSPDFVEGSSSGCSPNDNFIIGSILEKKVISNELLSEISDKYYINYSGLKNDLEIPESFDFSVVSVEIPEINMETDISSSSSVIARDSIFEVLYKNGTVISSKFTFKTWY